MTEFFSTLNGGHFAAQNQCVLLTRENAANGGRNVGRTQASHRDLVQQGLEQVVIPPIDQCNPDLLLAGQTAGSVQASEAASDDNDVFFVHVQTISQFIDRDPSRI